MQPSNTELILIRVTGEDRPGLTASVTEILAKYDATILDIGQADIHNTLSLGILFRSEERHSGFIMKELLFKASSLGVTIRFEPIGTDQYENWVGMQGKNRYILTVLGRKLSARQISAATRVLAEQDLNIDAIKRLTGRIPLDEDKTDTRTRACIEFSVRGTPKDRIAMQERLMQLASEQEMDFSFQQDNMYRRMRRLICFDMDSTLIETEVIDELAIRAGVGDEVKAITESFTRRVALLKGLDESVIMTRLKLKSYQDTYAVAMAKYGLQRGIDGSKARHKSTQQYYHQRHQFFAGHTFFFRYPFQLRSDDSLSRRFHLCCVFSHFFLLVFIC